MSGCINSTSITIPDVPVSGCTNSTIPDVPVSGCTNKYLHHHPRCSFFSPKQYSQTDNENGQRTVMVAMVTIVIAAMVTIIYNYECPVLTNRIWLQLHSVIFCCDLTTCRWTKHCSPTPPPPHAISSTPPISPPPHTISFQEMASPKSASWCMGQSFP